MVDLEQQISEVKRELAMRRHVYPRFVANEQITEADANHRIAALEAVLETLTTVKAERDSKINPRLF